MSVQKPQNYHITVGTASIGFSGPPNMSVAEIKNYIQDQGIDLSTWVDADWDDRITQLKDAQDRITASPLASKTPTQIYTYIQDQIGSWTSLADARTDLREWLPLMAAYIARLVQS